MTRARRGGVLSCAQDPCLVSRVRSIIAGSDLRLSMPSTLRCGLRDHHCTQISSLNRPLSRFPREVIKGMLTMAVGPRILRPSERSISPSSKRPFIIQTTSKRRQPCQVSSYKFYVIVCPFSRWFVFSSPLRLFSGTLSLGLSWFSYDCGQSWFSAVKRPERLGTSSL